MSIAFSRKRLFVQSAFFFTNSELKSFARKSSKLVPNMPINNRELMKAISLVSDNANVRVCVKQAGKGAFVCGAICLAGGLLLGPPGLAIGGTVGGLTAFNMSRGTFRPIGEILMNDLTEDQQEQLVQHVQAAVADVGVSDLALLIPLLARNADIQTAVLRTVTSFVTNELRMQIID